LPSKQLNHVAAETDQNGRVRVVGVDPAGAIWQSSRTGVATYGPWTQIDGQFRP